MTTEERKEYERRIARLTAKAKQELELARQRKREQLAALIAQNQQIRQAALQEV
ncbi:MAG TPA: hypothetical protein VEF04_12980 [Blastocatellia bacterium]|nr:hypothetical protein [Blastocatellia bacterium]